LCEKLDVPTSVNLTDYVNVDCDVIMQKEITDDEILADIMSDGNPCDDVVEEEDVLQSDRQSLTRAGNKHGTLSSRFSSFTN